MEEIKTPYDEDKMRAAKANDAVEYNKMTRASIIWTEGYRAALANVVTVREIAAAFLGKEEVTEHEYCTLALGVRLAMERIHALQLPKMTWDRLVSALHKAAIKHVIFISSIEARQIADFIMGGNDVETT